jgi:hypothetical protein
MVCFSIGMGTIAVIPLSAKPGYLTPAAFPILTFVVHSFANASYMPVIVLSITGSRIFTLTSNSEGMKKSPRNTYT